MVVQLASQTQLDKLMVLVSVTLDTQWTLMETVSMPLATKHVLPVLELLKINAQAVRLMLLSEPMITLAFVFKGITSHSVVTVNHAAILVKIV